MKASELLLASAEPFDKACLLVLKLEAENAELQRQLSEREWQPIDTSPEDCDILVLGNNYGDATKGWHCMVARRDGSTVIDTAEGNELAFITHWMPLPPAPSQEEK